MSDHKTHFINGMWCEGSGPTFRSTDPATGEALWQGREANLKETDHAVYAARQAFETWGTLPFAERADYLKTFQAELEKRKPDLARTISREVGKPLWESATEVAAMINKIPISIEAFERRCADAQKTVNGETVATRYRPHGVVAVFGPYNFPGHLANGHIVPALLAGNTVVLKQSEEAPLTGEKVTGAWESAGLPRGTFNLVQGARQTGQSLAGHPGLDGLFFTGSSQTGLALNRQFAERPDKILALEMGGNNPLVVASAADLKAAAYLTLQSAYLTAGQRCTCARRLIVPKGSEGDAFVAELARLIGGVKIGRYDETPEPFYGPVISVAAADAILAEQARLISNGAVPVAEARRLREGSAFLSPGLIEVTACRAREDKEVFGPLLQLVRVADFAAAIEEANNTRFGLAAGLISDDGALYEKFYKKARAGIVNWNRQLTGAVSFAPFGGVGFSGNHRPSAYFAADYCAYPVASIEYARVEMPNTLLPGVAA